MKKTFLFVAFFALSSGAAQAQTNAWADYFTIADSSHAFFVAPSGSALSAYSAPGGGHLIRETTCGSEKFPENWVFQHAALPAFLMIREAEKGARVFPLDAPVFDLQQIRKKESTIPIFQCIAGSRAQRRSGCGTLDAEKQPMETAVHSDTHQ